MEEDAAFRERVLELLWAGPNNFAPDGLTLLHADIESTITVFGPAGISTCEIPALLLRYRWRGQEGEFEFPLSGLFWGGFADAEDAVNYVWIELDEELTAVD